VVGMSHGGLTMSHGMPTTWQSYATFTWRWVGNNNSFLIGGDNYIKKIIFYWEKEYDTRMKMNLGLRLCLMCVVVCHSSLCDPRDFTSSVLERWLVVGSQFFG